MGIKKASKKFLRELGIDYKVGIEEWFTCYPDEKLITVPKKLPEYNKKEKRSHKFFQEKGIKVKHILTYSLLHEAGHAVSFSTGKGLTEKEKDDYMLHSQLLQDLVDNGMVTHAQGMEMYYKLPIENDANEEAVKLYNKYQKKIKKIDKKFCKKFPIKRV